MRTLLLFLTILAPAVAGNFNVIHLAGDKELTIEVSCDKQTQSFPLQPGAHSGPFTLPEKAAVFRVKDHDLKPLDAEASKDGRVVLLLNKENKLQWHVIKSEPAKEKSTLRLLNLSEAAVGLKIEDTRYELPPSQFLEVGAIDQNQISATLDGQKKQSTSAEEATAFIAVIHDTAEGPRLQFISDQ